jgi:choline dehydrogenase-like flavoprotein
VSATYDYIVAGAGSAGRVTAARLVRNHGARMLPLKAGGRDTARAVALPTGETILHSRTAAESPTT